MKGTPSTTAESTSGISDLVQSAHNHSLAYMLVEYAIKGMVFGAFVFVLIELCFPGWVPITRWSMLTMLIADMLLGELTLGFFRSDLPWTIIILAHCALTFIISICWVLINGWKTHIFHQELPLFIVMFVVVYACIWLALLLYSKAMTASMNKRINKFVVTTDEEDAEIVDETLDQ